MAHRILMVIAPEQFRDEELLVPRKRFEQEGWLVDTVSTVVGEAKGMLGHVENVKDTLSHGLDHAEKRMYDAVVVVGGMGSPDYLWNNGELHKIIRTVNQQGKVVAAICLSGAVLANAEVLKGKRATVWEMDESLACLEKGECHYTGEAVTVDGNLVTANGPEAAADFAEQVAARVKALTPA